MASKEMLEGGLSASRWLRGFPVVLGNLPILYIFLEISFRQSLDQKLHGHQPPYPQ